MFRKRLTILTLSIILLGLPIASAMAYEAFHGPTEVTYYDPAKAYNGITVFHPIFTHCVYMIDMDGRLIHKINLPVSTNPLYGFSGSYDFFAPLDNGNFLSLTEQPIIQEINWSGKVLWSYTPPPSTAAEGPAHHEVRKIWNSKLNDFTYLFIGGIQYTAAVAQAVGAKPPWTNFSPDGLFEVSRAGQIVWKWDFMDHLCQNLDPAKPNYVADVATKPGRLDVNTYYNLGNAPGPISGKLPQDWTHLNSLDYNQDLGLVVFNSRNLNEFYVVDHDKTFVSTTDWAANIAAAAGSDGDFVWRFGCPANYNQGDYPGWATNGNQQTHGEHNIQWIRKNMWPINNWNSPDKGPALPGAGHLLVFDNGGVNNNTMGSASRVLEINPYVNGQPVNGVYPVSTSYVNPPLADYSRQTVPWGTGMGVQNVSNQIVWKFEPNDSCSFLSQFISGALRMPNGNTLICAGNKGHMFEVTSAGELVWEYITPAFAPSFPSVAPIMMKNQHQLSNGPLPTFIHRVQRYPVTHPAFRNRVVQYADGTIQPINFNEAGVGFTLTGQAPCRNVPCQYIGHP